MRNILAIAFAIVSCKRLFSISSRIYESHKSFDSTIIRAIMIVKQHNFKKNKLQHLYLDLENEVRNTNCDRCNLIDLYQQRRKREKKKKRNKTCNRERVQRQIRKCYQCYNVNTSINKNQIKAENTFQLRVNFALECVVIRLQIA